MASHALDQRLFEQMQTMFGEGSSATASPTDGVQLINKWLTVLEGDNSRKTVNIEEKLKELRGQLQFTNPDADRVRELLMSLAEHTNQIAQGSDLQEPTINKLADLALRLQNFSSQF